MKENPDNRREEGKIYLDIIFDVIEKFYKGFPHKLKIADIYNGFSLLEKFSEQGFEGLNMEELAEIYAFIPPRIITIL